MKSLFLVVSLVCFGSVYADVVTYNLCANNTKTDCEALHMPFLGLIDGAAGHQTASCGLGCNGCAAFKAASAVTYLLPKSGDPDYSHYITFEANPNNVVYIQPSDEQNNFERIIVQEENHFLILKYCEFSTENIAATLEKYKKKHESENIQAGNSIIGKGDYKDLKTAFQAQVDSSYCDYLN